MPVESVVEVWSTGNPCVASAGLDASVAADVDVLEADLASEADEDSSVGNRIVVVSAMFSSGVVVASGLGDGDRNDGDDVVKSPSVSVLYTPGVVDAMRDSVVDVVVGDVFLE